MNYEAEIIKIISMAKIDKSLDPKWKNKAIARLEESSVFLVKDKGSTSLKPPEDVCTCPVGGIKTTCPIHGSSL